MDALIQELARAAMRADIKDLPGLAQLHELFLQVESAALAGGDTDIARIASDAASLVQNIIMEDTDESPEQAVDHVRSVVSEMQNLCDAAASNGGTDAGPGADIDVELLAAWVSGIEDVLTAVEAAVVELDAGGGDTDELMAEVRRQVHTVKGECGVLSLAAAQHLCHDVETLIDQTLAAGQSFPVDAVLRLLDWLREYVDRLAADPSAAPPDSRAVEEAFRFVADDASSSSSETSVPASDADSSADPRLSDPSPIEFDLSNADEAMLADFIVEAREHLSTSEGVLLDLEADARNQELLGAVFRAFHTIKGVAGFLNLGPIVALAHDAEFLLDKVRSEVIVLESGHIDLILASSDMMRRLIEALEGHGESTSKAAHAQLIVDLQRASAGEPVEGRTAVAATSASAPVEPVAPSEAAPTRTSAAPASGGGGDDAESPVQRRRVDQTVKVNTVRMDSLINMVGELVIGHQMLIQDDAIQQITALRTQRHLGHLGKIIRDLQEVAMSLRMVTLKSTFQKMARLVRDVSAKAGKNIRFVMEGEETELDRNLVDEIADPLVHMIRNSCDHGVEAPEDRIKAGKPEQGVLTLRAQHQCGSIVIEVRDDGRGLNREKILAKARERNLIDPDMDVADIPDREVYNMIFQPGFSTADQVTEVSGRGVGMDVVRRNIEALRGKVEIDSTPGEGSTIRIKLPLTMAIIDGIVVRVGEQRFVIPTLSIVQSFKPQPDDIVTAIGKGEMIEVRERMLPIHRLDELLDVEADADADALLVVVESPDGGLCITVDEILDQQQVVIKSLGKNVRNVRGVSGGAILGDGRVALILDVASLVRDARQMTVNGA